MHPYSSINTTAAWKKLRFILSVRSDSNYTRMLQAILNKSWRQHPTKHQLYSHLPPITKTIQVRQTSHAGHFWRSRDELISDVLLWTPHMAGQKQDNQLEHTFSSYVNIWDVALKTYQRRWTIGRIGERGSGISMLVAQHNDDDVYIYIYIYVCVCVCVCMCVCVCGWLFFYIKSTAIMLLLLLCDKSNHYNHIQFIACFILKCILISPVITNIFKQVASFLIHWIIHFITSFLYFVRQSFNISTYLKKNCINFLPSNIFWLLFE